MAVKLSCLTPLSGSLAALMRKKFFCHWWAWAHSILLSMIAVQVPAYHTNKPTIDTQHSCLSSSDVWTHPCYSLSTCLTEECMLAFQVLEIWSGYWERPHAQTLLPTCCTVRRTTPRMNEILLSGKSGNAQWQATASSGEAQGARSRGKKQNGTWTCKCSSTKRSNSYGATGPDGGCSQQVRVITHCYSNSILLMYQWHKAVW